MALTSILITGNHNSRGFEVLANGTARWIPRSLFEYLLELVTQIWATKSGFLFTQDVLSTEGDEERTRQVVHRLREELVDYQAIVNGRKSYRLACEAQDIAVDDSLFEVPSGILDPRILGRLKNGAA